MLKLDGSDSAGQTAYWQDDVDPLQVYVLPGEPTIAIRDGRPVFKFLKYRLPIERSPGVKGGGMLILQAELALSPKDEAEIRRRMSERLRQRGFPPAQADNIKIGRPLITRGKVTVSVFGEGTLVQKVTAATPPSLVGNNAVSIGVELNEFGAPVFEAVFKGAGAGNVVVSYELSYSAKLPAAHIVGTWDSSKFLSFSQTLDERHRIYGRDDYDEKVHEWLSNSESERIEWITQPPAAGMDAAQQQKMIDTIEDSVRRQLDEAVKRNVLEAIPPESRDISKLRDQGLDHITRTVDINRMASVRIEYSAAKVVDMMTYPNAPLGAFGSIRVNGQAPKWEDYAQTIDADDPFFKSFAIVFMMNADFTDLPIASVILQVHYKGPQGVDRNETFAFKKPEDILRFEQYLDGGTGEVDYSYTVNFKGESANYQSPVRKTKADVSINVGDLGLWKVDIAIGDVNFDEISQAQLRLWYDDGGLHREKQFTLVKGVTQQKLREVIFKARDQPWHYQVKYFLAGGREIEAPVMQGDGDQLYVNDPFSAQRTIAVRTKGDFDTVIDTLFLDFAYEDADHDYRQSKSFAFSKAGKRFEDWTFPVISEKSGTLKYTGNLVYKDGRPPKSIAEQAVTGNIVLEGEDTVKLDKLTVQVVTDLLDWSKLKLVTLGFAYVDDDNAIAVHNTVTLRSGGTPPVWSVDIRDKTKRSYTVSPHFFMADGTKSTPAPFTSDDDQLTIEMPA